MHTIWRIGFGKNLGGKDLQENYNQQPQNVVDVFHPSKFTTTQEKEDFGSLFKWRKCRNQVEKKDAWFVRLYIHEPVRNDLTFFSFLFLFLLLLYFINFNFDFCW